MDTLITYRFGTAFDDILRRMRDLDRSWRDMPLAGKSRKAVLTKSEVKAFARKKAARAARKITRKHGGR